MAAPSTVVLVLVLGLSLLLPGWAAAGDPSPPAPARPGRLQVYLLLGQSNMAERGVVEAQDRELHPRIFALDAGGSWQPARDPLDPAAPTRKSGEVRGVGPGMSFARAMATADPEALIGLVPISPYRGTPEVARVNQAIAGLPDRLPRTAVVDVADLATDGPWHFTAPAARKLGRRYAAAMQTLQAGSAP